MKTTTLYVNYTEKYESGGEVAAGEEESPWAHHNTTYYSYSVDSITLKNVTPYHEVIQWKGEPPEELYVVYVRYSDGSTFGSSSGHGSIEGVFEHEWEAQAAKTKILSGKWRSPHNSCRWDGYFNSLEDVEYCPVAVIV